MKNFTVRLNAADAARLERLASRLSVERSGALRHLLRRTLPCWIVNGAVFVPVAQGRAGRPLLIQLRKTNADRSRD